MTKWRDKLDITEVSKTQADTPAQPVKRLNDHENIYDNTSHATETERDRTDYRNIFKEEEHHIHSAYHLHEKQDKEKDGVAIALFMLGILGVFYLTAPDSLPATGKSSFMGLDIDLWFWFIKTVSIFSGAAMVPALIWKIRGESAGLKSFFNVLPNRGKFSLKLTASIFLASLFGGGLLHMNYNDLFKTPAQWQIAEALKIDSRDPVKRAQMVNVISPVPETVVTPQQNMEQVDKAINQHIIEQAADPLATQQDRLIQQKLRDELAQEENEKIIQLQQRQDQRLQEILQQKIKSIPQVR